jgi:DNA-binding winged helix-turn-helix (wHTH) protein/tetratricopeptide (TPR) repeat protein
MDATATSETYRFGPFRLEAQGAGLSRLDDGGTWKPVAIGSRALELLWLLLRRHGEVVTREEIMDAVWPGVAVEESNLTVQISALRRALDPTHAKPGCIQTVSGRGYRFLPTVTSELARAPLDEHGTVARTPQPDRRQRLSIIVAPFKSLSDDPDSALLADTITEGLTGDLARLPGTVVMAHAASGVASSAGHLIQGSVRRTTELTRVNVQLIDRVTSTHLWAEWFDVDQTATADDRDEIAGRLLRTLTVKLIEDACRRIEAAPLSAWTSDDLVLCGRALASRPLSEENRYAAINCFAQALVIEPASINARLGIAAVLVSNIMEGWSRSREADRARAEQLLLDVLRDDAEVSDGHLYMGSLRRLQGRLTDARIELEIAIALAPNSPAAYSQLGATLVFLGQPEAAIPHIEKSLRLAPHDRATPVNHHYLGLCHLMLGHIEEAITCLRKGRAGNPRLYYIHLILAAALGLKGELDEAAVALREAIGIQAEIGSFAGIRARYKNRATPQFHALCEQTVTRGLRLAGLPP